MTGLYFNDQPASGLQNTTQQQKEGLVSGFVIPTLKAIPKVSGAALLSLATGTGAMITHPGYMAGDILSELENNVDYRKAYREGRLLKDIKDAVGRGALTASNRSIQTMSFPQELLTTPEERKSFEYINAPVAWPMEKSGAGLAGISELVKTRSLDKAGDVITGKSQGSTLAVPILRSVGEGAFIVGIGGAKGAAQARLNANLGGLDTFFPENPGRPYTLTPEIPYAERVHPEYSLKPFVNERTITPETTLTQIPIPGKNSKIVTNIDGVNVLKVPDGSKIGRGTYTANQLKSISTNDLYDSKAVSLDEARQLAATYYNGLSQNPVSSPAFNGEYVSFGNKGWSHIVGKHERILSNDNIMRRLKLLPKVKATLENTPFVDEVRENDSGARKEYGILGRFADGDVIRVVVEEQNKNGKTFLSVFDWEDVSKKIKRNTLPESSLINNTPGLGVGKAPSNRVNYNITSQSKKVNGLSVQSKGNKTQASFNNENNSTPFKSQPVAGSSVTLKAPATIPGDVRLFDTKTKGIPYRTQEGSPTLIPPQAGRFQFVDEGLSSERFKLIDESTGKKVLKNENINTRESNKSKSVYIKTDPSMAALSLADFISKTKEIARQLFSGKVFKNKADGSEILVPWQGIKHAFSRGPSRSEATIALKLDEIIKSAIPGRIEADKYGRNNIKAVHHYTAMASIDGEQKIIDVVVREHLDGKRYYDHYEIKRAIGK